VFAAAGLLIAGLAVWWALWGRFEVATDNAHIRSDITMVAPQVQGYVAGISVADNQSVTAGDPVFTLDDREYRVRRDEAAAAALEADMEASGAEARAQAVRASLAVARARADAAQATGKEASLAISVAEAAAAQAEKDADRFKELAGRGWYPTARLDAARTQAQTASAAVGQSRLGAAAAEAAAKAARDHVAQMEKELLAAETAIASARARAAAASARLARATLDLDRTRVSAPVSGIVANRTIAVGQFLSAGQAALAIVPDSQAYVIANFKETQVGAMRAGQTVRIRIDAYPGMDVRGVVESLAPATGSTFSLMPLDTATGNFTKIVQRVPVRIRLSPEALSSGRMKPGLAVTARVYTRPQRPEE
jgi:membrane fusion protein (multidrug efflux system)